MKILLLAVPLALTACAGAQTPRWFDTSELKPVKEEDSKAVVLKVAERLTNREAGRFSSVELDRHMAIQVLTEDALKGAAEIRIPTSKDATIEDLRARSIDPDGNIRELAAGDIKEDESEVKTSRKGLDDKITVKFKVFRVPGVKVGSIVEIGYRTVWKGAFDAAEELGMATELDVPIRRYDIEVLVNDHIRYAARPYNSDVPVKKDRVGDMTRLSWTLTDIPGREEDDYAPHRTQELPWLAYRVKQIDHGNFAVNVVRNWADAFRPLADKLVVEKDLFDAPGPASQCGDDVRCKIDAAVAEVRKTPLHTLRSWTEDARSASKILEAKQASPLDKEVLLLDYLRSAGVEARPAAWIAPFTRLQDFEFPSPGSFNELAVYVPAQKGLAKAMWIAPSCEECAAGQLSDAMVGAEPWVIQGTERFAKDSEVEVERIRPQGTPPPVDEMVSTTDMTLDGAGALKATRVTELKGNGATVTRIDRHAWVESKWSKLADEIAGWIGSTARAPERASGNCDATAGTCTTTVRVEAPAYATVAGDQLVVPLTAMKTNFDGLLSLKSRKSGIAFQHPEVVTSVARVHVPAGYKAQDLPPRTETDAPGLKAAVESHQEGDVVVVTRTLKFTPGLYGVETYEAHRKAAHAFSAAKDMLLTFARSPAPVTMPQLQ